MRKAKNESADIQQLRSALVREGLTTYPLAMQAIAEFRHEVFEILKRVAERKKAEISLDGPDTFLRVAMGSLCSFSLEFFWADVGRRSATVGIAATIWCDKKATFEKVATALQDEYGEDVVTDDEERWCSHEKTIQPEQFDKLESELGKLCDAWIKKLNTVNIRKLIRSTR